MNKKNPSPQTKKGRLPPKEIMPAKLEQKEVNGYESLGLPEPTRYNDWEVKGRCSDF